VEYGKFGGMYKRYYKILLITLLLLIPQTSSFAFWVWTPESNEWVNPKYSVKDTPSEQLQYALEFYQLQEYKKATQEFKKLIKNYPRSKEAPEAQFNIGLCLEEQEEYYKAFKQYQLVIDKYPFSERSAEIVQRQYDIGIKILEGQNQRSKFIQSFVGSDYNVVDVFKTVIKNAPYGKVAPLAQYKIGLYLLEKRLFQEARDEFEKVINDYPESEWAKAAKYQIAVTDAKRSTNAQYDQKITQAAVKEFNEFVKIYPDAELSKEAKEQVWKLKEKEAENNYVIAQFYEKQKNYKAAKVYYQIVVDEYKQSQWASVSLKKILEMSMKLQ